jgi:hypothetical protein
MIKKLICDSKMRTFIPVIILFLITRVCHAPLIDFELKMNKLRTAIDLARKNHHERELSRFINDLGYRESENNWLAVNLIGCFGEWQFAESTLHSLGYRKITLKKFKANPNSFPRDVQLQALKGLIRLNMHYLRNYEHFIGDTIKDVLVTKSGMIAASHLGGARTLMKFLDSEGQINRKDVLGTSIYDYMKRFSGYDLE